MQDNTVRVEGTVLKKWEEATQKGTQLTRLLVLNGSGKWEKKFQFTLLGKTKDVATTLSPGDRVVVQGKLSSREWTNPKGVTQYFTDVYVNDIFKALDATAAPMVSDWTQDADF